MQGKKGDRMANCLGLSHFGFSDSRRSKGRQPATFPVPATRRTAEGTRITPVNSKYAGVERPQSALHGAAHPRYAKRLTIGDFNFAVGGGVPFNVNGTRSPDTLVTIDGAPAVRTRANGAIIGVANVDATEEVQPIMRRSTGVPRAAGSARSIRAHLPVPPATPAR
jgi:hypothetical protein